jgi:hypothetical protein
MALRAKSMVLLLSGALLALTIPGSPVRADEPTPAAMDTANKIIVDLGLKPSLDVIVPVLFGEFEKNVLATRPELKDSLHATLVSLVPEFSKGEAPVLADVAHVMATRMTEAELKEVLTFYETPTGKKFIQSESAFVSELQSSGAKWRQQISQQLVPRVREELKKKGVDF